MVKSVMEKYQDALIQKEKYDGAQLAQTVNQIHKLLSSACSGGSEAIALEASQFLTWLLFENYTDDYLTNEFRQELMKDSEILSIINKFNYYAKESIRIGELGNQYRLTNDKSIMAEIGKFSQEKGIFTEEGLAAIINHFINEDDLKIKQSGADQMTTWIPSWTKNIMNNSVKTIDKTIDQLIGTKQVIKQGRRLRFAYKDVKLDTMADNPNAQITFGVEDQNLQKQLQSVYSVLASATIKSKNDLSRIDLEDATIIKAYSAFINYSRKKKAIPQAQIKNLFSKYYTTEELKDDPYITLHLNHIISTYALTGLGTTLKSDLNSILDGARYMIVIDNINRKVIIHSTNKIINEIILKNNYSKGLVSKVNLNLTRI